MNNLLILPMLLPVLAGVTLIFFRSYGRFQALISLAVMIVVAGLSIYLLIDVQNNGIMRLDFGGWEPPFGILFVADTFSMLLVVTTSIVTIICLLYAAVAAGRKMVTLYFYPSVLFLNAGVIGSFMTGDMFNLFVCFEVMLLSSYALLTLGGSKRQLREAIKYVSINIVSSWFFLVALAFLYGSIGSLNMAHIAARVAENGQEPILTTVSIVFLIVFSLKAGLLLYFWLPGSYSAPPAVTSALFGALLTKVGIYALFRVFTLIFPHQPDITSAIIGVMAALTLIGGSLGAVAFNDIRKIAAYNVIISVGFILVGLSIATPNAMEGAIYYLVHDMIAKALLFLVVGTMVLLTGTAQIEKMSGMMKNYPVLGWTFFISMLTLAGVPPLSGFIGKVFITEGAIDNGSYVLLALSLISSLFVLYSLLRIFKDCFWGETIVSRDEQPVLRKGILWPSLILVGLTLALGLGVELWAPFVENAAYTLLHPEVYIDAILGDGR
ncbi:Na+/H+ antiporter subunit D [Planomicrobium sp. YIM 101495]|uniref:Na+/H+ antiporter subunit D n=1 Tax=Planomicrobium sp. YIM 101495 TaxID=2665160 RepID=UPI0012B8BE46|nr:Na+/H+ antiporter subunit D [Planomicrobium sp. YIM 101495]MTD31092.1 Na+/H+ antiporter subunit D [Planomicrobium sp. YIM 101495]